MNNNFDEGAFSKIGDFMHYFIQTGKYESDESKNIRAEFLSAQQLKSLELFHPSKLPEDAFEMWKKMTSNGTKLKTPIKKAGEVPKITFNRFIQKKRDDYTKKRKEFEEKYGYDYKLLDFNQSNIYHIVKK